MVIAVSLLIALAGVVMFALAANAKVAEMGRIMFFVGLLAFLIGLPGHPVSLLPK